MKKGSIRLKLRTLPFLLLIFVLFNCDVLTAEPKDLKPVPKQSKPKEIIKNDTSREILVNHFGIKVYLFPDRKSDILRVLKFGERVVYDSETLELPNEIWVPIRTKEGLSGHILRDTVKFVSKEKYLDSFVFEADKYLNSNSLSLLERMEITDSLFSLSTSGDYSADSFTFIRTKAGFGLKRTLDLINQNKIKPDSSPELLDFLKRHQSKLLYDYSDFLYYVDPNYFWKLIETNPNTKHADYAGYLASEVLPSPECKNDLGCELENLRKTKMRYIYQFPNGNYANLYFKEIITKLKKITKDPDSIACYQPLSQLIRSEITLLRKYAEEFTVRHRKEIIPYISILQKECIK